MIEYISEPLIAMLIITIIVLLSWKTAEVYIAAGGGPGYQLRED